MTSPYRRQAPPPNPPPCDHTHAQTSRESSPAPPHPHLAPFFAGNGATVTDGSFTASLLVKGAGDALTIESASFEAVVQLRINYANRVLQETGQFLSRIGVDFLNRPKATPGKKDAKAAAESVSSQPIGAAPAGGTPIPPASA